MTAPKATHRATRSSRCSVYAHTVTSDPARISVTAKLSAYYRKFSDIAFAAEVASLIGADEAFAALVREHALEPDKLAFYAPMFEARYKSITHLITACGATQVLELACGYSLRGLDLTQNSTLHYVETDLPDVIATKRQLLDDIRRRHDLAPRPLHTVTPADALDLTQLQAAAAAFDRARPLVILCEGLVGYLTKQETTRLTINVHTLLRDFTRGWWIVPDFTFKSELQNLPPERLRLREAVTGLTERQLDASAFEDAEDLSSFLRTHGFEAQVRSQIDETPSFSTLEPLHLSPTVLDRLRPVLRVWLMTTASSSAGRAVPVTKLRE
jgi:O-methyltransferase involved in polyketide biosynthesis